MKDHNELDQFASLLKDMMKMLHARGRRNLSEENFSFSQYYALFLLGDGKNHEMGSLKKALMATAPVATKIADHLIDKKYAVRGRWSSKDKRIVNIIITDQGKNLLKKIEKKRMKFLSSTLTNMTAKEKKVVIEGLNILLNKILDINSEKNNA